MPEIVLHYIWERCLWAGFKQFTTDGREIEILSVGEHNRDAGPDYSHARIRVSEISSLLNSVPKRLLILLIEEETS